MASNNKCDLLFFTSSPEVLSELPPTYMKPQLGFCTSSKNSKTQPRSNSSLSPIMPFLQGLPIPVHDPTSHPNTCGGFKRCPQTLQLPPIKRWCPSPTPAPELACGTALMNKMQSNWCCMAAEARAEKTGSFCQFLLVHSQ